ncbi:hypothetical protein TRFO_18852 [Tritrichomonas foetus]|uniref:Importin N-terminal domain-containing protein n=1 Tax=Tritrichomonas foetus TaxID=1144522 RepID=A0A1J4KKY1_9EUKA|nr:hypothetical protein TRFO_18852 [Tritrichomonas foetus]|eukprot:OHT11600.1 hypothetical protein TRFO_18852 [Tritrichomonas foetus]
MNPTPILNEFVNWAVLSNSGSIEEQNQANSFLRFFKLNPNNLDTILEVIRTPSLPEYAYWYASIILRDRIRHPLDNILFSKSSEIFMTLQNAIINQQRDYPKMYYIQYLINFGDLLIITKNIVQLPSNIIRPIQNFFYYQLNVSISCPYFYSFYTESEAKNLASDMLEMTNLYVTSLANERIDLKVNAEWLKLLKFLLSENINFDFGTILSTVEYALQFPSIYEDLVEFMDQELLIYESMIETELNQELFHFLISLVKHVIIFSNKLIETDQKALLLVLWTRAIDFPVYTLTDLMQDGNEFLMVFLNSYMRAVCELRKTSIQSSIDLVGKTQHILINFFDMTESFVEFLKNFFLLLINLSNQSTGWNYAISQISNIIYTMIPEICGTILMSHEPVPGIFFMISVLKQLPEELIKCKLQQLFTLETFPEIGIAVIRKHFKLAITMFGPLVYQIFDLNGAIASSLFHQYAVLLENIFKFYLDCFNICDHRVISFFQRALISNIDFFNIENYHDALDIYLSIISHVNDDSARTELCSFLKKVTFDFCQCIINQALSGNPNFTQLLGIFNQGVHKYEDRIDIIKYTIVSAVSECLPDEILLTLPIEGHQTFVSLAADIFQPNFLSFLPDGIIQKYLGYIFNCFNNKFFICEHFFLLTNLFKCGGYLPPEFLNAVLTAYCQSAIIDNNIIQSIGSHLKNVLPRYKALTGNEIWKYVPLNLLMIMITSNMRQIIKSCFKIIKIMISSEEKPPNFCFFCNIVLIIGFFITIPSDLFDKAISLIIKLNPTEETLKFAIQHISSRCESINTLLELLLSAILSICNNDYDRGKLHITQFSTCVKILNDQQIECFKLLVIDTMH